MHIAFNRLSNTAYSATLAEYEMIPCGKILSTISSTLYSMRVVFGYLLNGSLSISSKMSAWKILYFLATVSYIEWFRSLRCSVCKCDLNN